MKPETENQRWEKGMILPDTVDSVIICFGAKDNNQEIYCESIVLCSLEDTSESEVATLLCCSTQTQVSRLLVTPYFVCCL
jgi:hypothetical protein